MKLRGHGGVCRRQAVTPQLQGNEHRAARILPSPFAERAGFLKQAGAAVASAVISQLDKRRCLVIRVRSPKRASNTGVVRAIPVRQSARKTKDRVAFQRRTQFAWRAVCPQAERTVRVSCARFGLLTRSPDEAAEDTGQTN